VLSLGDHDPSGVHCFSALDRDFVAFAQHYGGPGASGMTCCGSPA
jgi:hypothetical protein